ncbi:MAG TPA: ATP-binding cassette domain-containing protein, partial [Acetivibrio sp.]|nr:ATP-binding cassette domain-containing protein [Acetivibrio sp.]
EAIIDRQNRSKTMRKTPKRMGNSEARLHKQDAKQKQQKIDKAVNSLKTRLEKLEVKERPRSIPRIKLDFSLTDPPKNKVVISSDGLTFGYGSKKIFDNVKFKVYNGSKTALWGENGAGKTTLLNLIGCFSDESINVVPKAKLGYFRQGFENLECDKTVLENVMKDSIQSQSVARTILARLLISGEDVHKRVGVLSGGEKIKVSFAKLFVSDANVLLMDEPTNYLDMQSIEALEDVLLEYEGTVLFVSHDRGFVNKVADRLLIVENREIIEFEGTPKEYFDGRKKPVIMANSEAERIALQMKITEVVARLSEPGEDKEMLEEEYRRLIQQLK